MRALLRVGLALWRAFDGTPPCRRPSTLRQWTLRSSNQQPVLRREGTRAGLAGDGLGRGKPLRGAHLRVSTTAGRTWNFTTDAPNADMLLVFQQKTAKAFARLAP